MPLILKNKANRIALQFARSSALRATDEVIQQLQDQLAAARLELSQKEVEIAKLRYEMAKRDREAAFAQAPSPSGMVH